MKELRQLVVKENVRFTVHKLDTFMDLVETVKGVQRSKWTPTSVEVKMKKGKDTLLVVYYSD